MFSFNMNNNERICSLTGIYKMNKAGLIGLIVCLSVFIFSLCLKPEATCKDGWKSPSIGRPGACSHHGGVDYKTEYPFIGLIIGIYLGRKAYLFSIRLKRKKMLSIINRS